MLPRINSRHARHRSLAGMNNQNSQGSLRSKEHSREHSRDYAREVRDRSQDKENATNTSLVLQRVVDMHKNRKIAQAPKPLQDITLKMNNFKNSSDLNASQRYLGKKIDSLNNSQQNININRSMVSSESHRDISVNIRDRRASVATSQVTTDRIEKVPSRTSLNTYSFVWEAIDLEQAKSFMKREIEQTDQLKNQAQKGKSQGWFNRANMIDCMQNITADFKCKRETCYVAINYFDRFMLAEGMKREPQETQVQEIAATCLQMAAKYEEIYPPGIEQFAKTPEKSVQPSDIQKLELKVLTILGWKVTSPTALQWLGMQSADWDRFISRQSRTCREMSLREPTRRSHDLLAECVQLLDASQLASETYNISMRHVTLSILYCVLKKYQLGGDFAKIFSTFLDARTDSKLNRYDLDVLSKCTEFVTSFHTFQPMKENKWIKQTFDVYAKDQFKWEDVLAYQTFNKNMFKVMCTLKKKDGWKKIL